MEQVAQMLGVELGEIFYIKNSYYKYRLTEKSIEFYDGLNQQWNICPYRILYLLNGDAEIIKKPILDDIERRYLSNVIKPFIDRIEYIIKNSAYSPIEWITIKYKDGGATPLPLFEKGTMYKGMEANKRYSLSELGV